MIRKNFDLTGNRKTIYKSIGLTVLLTLGLVVTVSADTYVPKKGGNSFDGYISEYLNDNRAKVIVDTSRSQMINLNDYEIEFNFQGRRDTVVLFDLTEPLTYSYELRVFVEGLEKAAKRGPRLIMFRIDMVGPDIEMAHRISTAIINLTNAKTVAFVEGRGALETAAIIALSCDKVIMEPGSSIGAVATGKQDIFSPSGLAKVSEAKARVVPEKWKEYALAVAKRKQRPELFIEGMVNSSIALDIVNRNGQEMLVSQRTPRDEIVKNLTDKDDLLTLDAETAVRFGVADDVAQSAEKSLEVLGTAGTRIVPDRTLAQARQRYAQIFTRFDRIIEDINFLEERAERIADEIAKIQELIEIANRSIRGGVEYLQQDYYRYPQAERDLRELSKRRDELSAMLVRVLRDLIPTYRTALSQAQRHDDLQEFIPALNENLRKAIDITRKEITHLEFSPDFRMGFRSY